MQHRTSCLCITPCQCASALAQGDPSPRVKAQINFAKASLSAVTMCFYQLCWYGRFCHMDVCPLWNPNCAYQLIRDTPLLPFLQKLRFQQQTPKAGLGFFFSFHTDAPSILSAPRLQLLRAHKRDTQDRHKDEIFQQERWTRTLNLLFGFYVHTGAL